MWSGIYLATMVLGYVLKRLGVFRPEDRKFLSNLIFYVTLPAMLITGFTGATVDLWFLVSIATVLMIPIMSAVMLLMG